MNNPPHDCDDDMFNSNERTTNSNDNIDGAC